MNVWRRKVARLTRCRAKYSLISLDSQQRTSRNDGESFEKTNFTKACSFSEVNPALGRTRRGGEREKAGNSRERIEFVSEVSIITRSKASVKISRVYGA